MKKYFSTLTIVLVRRQLYVKVYVWRPRLKEFQDITNRVEKLVGPAEWDQMMRMYTKTKFIGEILKEKLRVKKYFVLGEEP